MLLLRKRLCINCSSWACTSLGNIPCLKFGRNNLNSYNSKTHVTDNSNKFWIPLRIRITWVQKYLLFIVFFLLLLLLISVLPSYLWLNFSRARAFPWKSRHEGLKKIFVIDLIFEYYTSCPSVINFNKNLSYQQINKPNWYTSLQ